MVHDVELKNDIIALLKELPAYNSNYAQTEHVVRCPYCGDSRNPLHSHFSIGIDVDSDVPMLFRCLKCDEVGLLTRDVLNDLGIYVDDEFASELKRFNRKQCKKNNLINTNYEKLAVPRYADNVVNRSRLEYINERIGSNFTFGDAVDLKIVINLFDFIKFNDIKTIPGADFKYLSFINQNYVGFLSTNNNCIIFRRLDDSNTRIRRYVKLKINPRNLNRNTFYSIPNAIDIMYTHPIDIHIGEGTFDIISVFHNVLDRNKINQYYFASCGFGSATILRYLIYNGINTGLNIHIYSDNDKTDFDHKYYLSRDGIQEWLDTVWIHRNRYPHEKDYGVNKEKIIDSKKLLISTV